MVNRPVDDIHQAKSRIGGHVRLGNPAGADRARGDLKGLKLLRDARTATTEPALSPEQAHEVISILDEYVASILRDVPPPPREAVEAVRRAFRPTPARTGG